MVVKVSKPEINVREKISELDKPSGVAGEAMLRAETPQEQFNLINAGRRNLIINGDMKIDQRNGGSSITNTGNNLFPLDRWLINLASDYFPTVSSGQNLDSLAPPPGFDKYIGVKIDSGTAAPAAPFLSIRQIIEGNNITCLDYGKSTAKDITISFWARTNHPGTYTVAVRGGTTQTACVTEFSVDSADTWQYISVIIPGQKDTTTTWPLDYAGEGLIVNIGLGSFQGTYSSSTLDQWVTGSFTGSATQTQDFAQTTGNTFYVTGVQLEVGKVATPFEYRSYGEELLLCSRYYTSSFRTVSPQDGALGTDNRYYSPAWKHSSGSGLVGSVNNFVVPMRTKPTMTFYRDTGVSSTDGRWGYYNSSSWGTASAATGVQMHSHLGFTPSINQSETSITQNYLLLGGWAADAEL